MQWMRQQSRAPLEPRGRDKAMEAYLDHMYLKGKGIFDARHAVYGFGFVHDIDVTKHGLPGTHRALRGYVRAAPGSERDPMPWEAAVAVAHDLCTNS
eukprot:9374358-Heterocapsa_arctica.AAC.1